MRSEELDTLFTNIADSIRTAEDSADPINVVDFPTRIALLSSGGIPSGFIGIWSGTVSNIPNGWALCDGTNGTPDLRDRFVLGAGTKHSVGDSGGEERVTLTEAQIPTHYHIQSYGSEGKGAGTPNAITRNTFSLSNKQGSVTNSGSYTFYTDGSSYVYTGPAGSSQPHNNMPPYYSLCYIMKL